MSKKVRKETQASPRKRRVLRIEDRPYVSLDGKPAWGVYHGKHKLIEMLESLEAFDYMDTMIHEMLHHYCPDLSEKRVEKIATEIAKALWERRYRRIAK